MRIDENGLSKVHPFQFVFAYVLRARKQEWILFLRKIGYPAHAFDVRNNWLRIARRDLRCGFRASDEARHILGRKTSFSSKWEIRAADNAGWVVIPDHWFDSIRLDSGYDLADVTAEHLHDAVEIMEKRDQSRLEDHSKDEGTYGPPPDDEKDG